MQEIEVKAYLRNKDSVLKKLQELGCAFSAPQTQEDTVYVKEVGTMETFLSNTEFVRIRVQNSDRILFTVKQRMGALVAIEHETLGILPEDRVTKGYDLLMFDTF